MARLITITGSAQLTAAFDRNIDNYETTFRRQFAEDGWQIVNLDFQQSAWFGINIPFNILIKAYVPDEYTNQEHLEQAFRRLSGYELCFPGGWNCGTVITGINLQISGEDKPGAVRPQPVRQPTRPGSSSPPTNPIDPNAYGLPPAPSPFDASFFDNLATGLGVSTPVAIAILIIGGIIILKK